MTFHERLARNDLLVGTMVSEVKTPNLAMMLATAGMDWALIDMEHGTYDWSEMAALVTAFRGTGVAPFVRIPEVRRETVLKPLDAGAAGLVVPQVEDPQTIRDVVSHAKYIPAGRRGVALRRAHSAYAKQPAVEYMENANAQTALFMQIESQAGLDNVEEMAAVEGFDGFFIGPFDMSVDMGIPAQIGDGRMWAAFDRVISATRAENLVVGMQLFDHDSARQLIEKGVRLASYSSDVQTIVDTFTNDVTALKA